MTEKRLRLAVIGAGEHATNVIHPALIFNDRIDVVGCCDRDTNRANLAAKRLAAPAFTEASHMLSTVKADAAIVVAFPWVQAELTIECLEAGLHVFTEKPLATELDQAKRVKAAAAKAKRQVSVGFMMRFNPVFQKMQEAIKSVGFGEPSLFHSRFVAGYRPKTSDLLRVGSIHIFDLARWLFGPFREVYATHFEKEDGQVSIAVNATLGGGVLRDGALGHGATGKRTVASLVLSSLGLWASKGQLYAEVIGDRNVFSVDNARDWTWQKPPLETIREGNTQTMKEIPRPAELAIPNYMNVSRFDMHTFFLNGYYGCIEAFVDSLLGNGEGANDLPMIEDGIAALETAIAIEQSVQTGQSVRL
ncbi:MAG: Gfo/Idh/MocA family oxidoreductase [Chloroflexota bacterium]